MIEGIIGFIVGLVGLVIGLVAGVIGLVGGLVGLILKVLVPFLLVGLCLVPLVIIAKIIF